MIGGQKIGGGAWRAVRSLSVARRIGRKGGARSTLRLGLVARRVGGGRFDVGIDDVAQAVCKRGVA